MPKESFVDVNLIILPPHAAMHQAAPKPTLKLGKWGGKKTQQLLARVGCLCVYCRGGRGSDHVPSELKWLSVSHGIILDLLSTKHVVLWTPLVIHQTPVPLSFNSVTLNQYYSFCLKRTLLPFPTFPSNTNVGFPDWFPKTGSETMVKRMNELRHRVWWKKLNATFHFFSISVFYCASPFYL